MKVYKVLETIWYKAPYCLDFQQEYYGSFKTIEEARTFIKNNEQQWLDDVNQPGRNSIVGVGVELETWDDDELLETYTEWCRDR